MSYFIPEELAARVQCLHGFMTSFFCFRGTGCTRSMVSCFYDVIFYSREIGGTLSMASCFYDVIFYSREIGGTLSMALWFCCSWRRLSAGSRPSSTAYTKVTMTTARLGCTRLSTLRNHASSGSGTTRCWSPKRSSVSGPFSHSRGSYGCSR